MGRGKKTKIPEKSKKDRDENLRAENRKLRKEIQQLRRLTQKRTQREEELEEVIEEFESLEFVNQAQEEKFECPECYSKDTSVLDLGHKKYYTCNKCGSKGPVK